MPSTLPTGRYDGNRRGASGGGSAHTPSAGGSRRVPSAGGDRDPFPRRERRVPSAGVSSGIAMALHLLGRIAGDETARAVQLRTEYDPQPPCDAGSTEKAPAGIVAKWRAETGRPGAA
ncbi:hypothetical protein ACFYNX_24910 [Streptomyces sp. NPDC007872]|uniref:hypothetical protein n=1 Tax=Streptomyces sp. NPDC007872 TaxID=3364782 RepID=UPI00367E927F